MQAAFLVGVDGGGSRTRAVVTRSDLYALGSGASGPANASMTPLPRVVESIREAVEDALAAAGATVAEMRALSCGVAGIEGPALSSRLLPLLQATFPATLVLLTNDARVALAGAIDGPVDGPGIVLIAGTGAIAFGRNAHGLEERAGGWGPVVGDEGSGHEIGRKGLAAALRDLDGRGPRTSMREALFATEGTRSPLGLLRKLYISGGGPADVAAYFPLVVEAARKGDTIAIAILREAGEGLALSAATVVAKLGLKDEPVDVATVGGVFSAGQLVLDALGEGLARRAPLARLVRPKHPPEVGAIRLALARLSEAA